MFLLRAGEPQDRVSTTYSLTASGEYGPQFLERENIIPVASGPQIPAKPRWMSASIYYNNFLSSLY